MSVILDSKEMAADSLGLTTVGDLLAHLKRQRRLVTQLLIDGEEPSFDDMSRWRDLPIAAPSAPIVYVETTDAADIGRQVLGDALVTLRETDGCSAAAVSALDACKPDKAMASLAGCFAAWGRIRESVEKVAQLVRLDPDRLVVAGMSLRQIHDEFNAAVSTIKRALERRDFSALRSALAIDLPPILGRWQQALDEMVGLLNPTSAA